MFRSIPALRLSRALATHASNNAGPRTWAKREIQDIYESPLLDLVFRAASVHRQHHDPSKIQLCTLMNIKSVF
jgi:biotin synthase